MARGGTLSDHLEQLGSSQQLTEFCQRLARILYFLHYEALGEYRAENERKGEGGPLGFMHRDVKPQNIVWTDPARTPESMYLLDFGISKVVYTEEYRPYLNCGTSSYKAPEIGDGRVYCANVDVYSFGCVLYEVLTGGQRLLSHAGLRTSLQERVQYVEGRLDELQYKLRARNEELGREEWEVEWWMHLLRNTLCPKAQKRWGTRELVRVMEQGTTGGTRVEEVPGLKDIVVREELFTFQWEQFRLSLLQHKIDCLFEYLYFDRPNHSKFITFVFIKFVTLFVVERFLRLKRWAESRHKPQWQMLKRTVHIERMQDVLKNCPKKLER